MPKIYLTDTFADSAICPKGKGQELYWDYPKSPDGKVRRGAQKGLGLRVTANGIKSYVHAYVFEGKRRRVVLGSAQTINVGTARLIVSQREQQLQNSEDPDALPVAVPTAEAVTLSDIARAYFEKHMKFKCKKYQNQFFCIHF